MSSDPATSQTASSLRTSHVRCSQRYCKRSNVEMAADLLGSTEVRATDAEE